MQVVVLLIDYVIYSDPYDNDNLTSIHVNSMMMMMRKMMKMMKNFDFVSLNIFFQHKIR